MSAIFGLGVKCMQLWPGNESQASSDTLLPPSCRCYVAKKRLDKAISTFRAANAELQVVIKWCVVTRAADWGPLPFFGRHGLPQPGHHGDDVTVALLAGCGRPVASISHLSRIPRRTQESQGGTWGFRLHPKRGDHLSESEKRHTPLLQPFILNLPHFTLCAADAHRHPFILDPSVPQGGEDCTSYRQRRSHGKDWIKHLQLSGAPDGAAFKDWRVWPHTLQAHELVCMAAEEGKDSTAVELLFRRT